MSNKFVDELKRSMKMLAEDPRTVFLGQAVRYGGTGMYDTLVDVPDYKKVEMPVAENLQMGISIGMAISEDLIPVSIFPRWNFLLNAADQLVNHLDKISLMSDGQFKPKVIIRTAVGSTSIIDPQEQHRGNFSAAFRSMFKTVEVIELIHPNDVYDGYYKALHRDDGRSTILVEFSDYMLGK